MSTDHLGGNILNAIALEEHVGALNAKRVSIASAATIYVVSSSTNSGNVTLNPSPNFIGIVTVANSQANTGNVTLNPSPNFIGLVTVANNITIGNAMVTVTLGTGLDATNDNVAIKGNLTLSDAKTYLGLTTTTLGVGTSYIGLASINGSVVNLAGANYIGLASVNVGGIAAGANYIGLASVNIGGGNVGVSGNITLSDSKTFIGLTTVKASILDTFSSLQTLTISLASIASSTVGVGRQSTLVDNTTTKYTSANIYLKLLTGGISSTPNSLIYTHLIRYDGNTVADDGAGTTDAALTVANAPLLGTILVTASTASTAYYGVFDTSPLGPLGPQWGIAVVNSAGAALNGVEGNMLKNWIGVNRQLT